VSFRFASSSCGEFATACIPSSRDELPPPPRPTPIPPPGGHLIGPWQTLFVTPCSALPHRSGFKTEMKRCSARAVDAAALAAKAARRQRVARRSWIRCSVSSAVPCAQKSIRQSRVRSALTSLSRPLTVPHLPPLFPLRTPPLPPRPHYLHVAVGYSFHSQQMLQAGYAFTSRHTAPLW